MTTSSVSRPFQTRSSSSRVVDIAGTCEARPDDFLGAGHLLVSGMQAALQAACVAFAESAAQGADDGSVVWDPHDAPQSRATAEKAALEALAALEGVGDDAVAVVDALAASRGSSRLCQGLLHLLTASEPSIVVTAVQAGASCAALDLALEAIRSAQDWPATAGTSAVGLARDAMRAATHLLAPDSSGTLTSCALQLAYESLSLFMSGALGPSPANLTDFAGVREDLHALLLGVARSLESQSDTLVSLLADCAPWHATSGGGDPASLRAPLLGTLSLVLRASTGSSLPLRPRPAPLLEACARILRDLSILARQPASLAERRSEASSAVSSRRPAELLGRALHEAATAAITCTVTYADSRETIEELTGWLVAAALSDDLLRWRLARHCCTSLAIACPSASRSLSRVLRTIGNGARRDDHAWRVGLFVLGLDNEASNLSPPSTMQEACMRIADDHAIRDCMIELATSPRADKPLRSHPQRAWVMLDMLQTLTSPALASRAGLVVPPTLVRLAGMYSASRPSEAAPEERSRLGILPMDLNTASAIYEEMADHPQVLQAAREIMAVFRASSHEEMPVESLRKSVQAAAKVVEAKDKSVSAKLLCDTMMRALSSVSTQ